MTYFLNKNLKSNTMKLKNLFIIAYFFILVGCSKSESTSEAKKDAPVIENTEVGIENSKKVFAESDLHLEAVISSSVGIQSVRVQILPEGYGNAWFVDKHYDWQGKKEGHLHIHYDVPKKALPSGVLESNYDIIITATDINGQKTTFKDLFKVINDPDLPKISQGKQSYDPKTKQVTLQAKIKAPKKIKQISVRVGPAINHTFTDEKYIGKTEVDFLEVIDGSKIPNPNHFHSYLMVTDEANKSFTIDLGAH